METTASGDTGSSSAPQNPTGGSMNTVAASGHAAVDFVAKAADEAARNAKPAIDRVAAMAHQAVDKAAGVAAPTAEWLAQQGESLSARQKQLVDDTCSYISDNPLKSVGIALLAGLVLSRIVRR